MNCLIFPNEIRIENESELILPFKLIHEVFKYKWVAPHIFCWIFKVPIYCRIEQMEPPTKLYNIKFSHGIFKWEIHRSLSDLKILDFRLRIFKYKKKLFSRDYSATLKSLPTNKDSSDEQIEILEEYMKTILSCVELRNHKQTLMFCNVSYISFNKEYGCEKGREEICYKRPGGYYGFKLKHGCTYWFLGWQRRWLVLKKPFMAYINMKDQRIGGVILLDNNLDVGVSPRSMYRLVAINRTRIFKLKFHEEKSSKEWSTDICQICDNSYYQSFKIEKEPISNEDVICTNKANVDKGSEIEMDKMVGSRLSYRYNSFASERLDCYAYWFVDGSQYFSSLADALYSARKEIYICDWWLSPQLYLKRPLHNDCIEWRLDTILKKKAEQGVKIFILIYKELPFALGINSYYTKQFVSNLHPNIYILRHPDHLLSNVFVWSHHEKIVCIDQSIAFLGGLDICYGRWDDQGHRLTDVGVKEISYNFHESGEYDPHRYSKMWKDYGGRIIRGIQRPTPALYELINAATILKDSKIIPPYRANLTICRSLTTWSGGIKYTESSILQAYISLIKESKRFIYIENQFFVSIHENSMVMNGIAEALYQRIILAYSNKHEFKVYIVMPLLPGFEGQIGEKTGTFLKAVIYWTSSSFYMGRKSLIQRLRTSIENPFEYISICGLRKYTKLNDKLVTELIYVHSKLLIVDDECCIIGSANINDRSLLGDRDSEIAAIFKDNSKNMENKEKGTFCSTLRKNIFKEHFLGSRMSLNNKNNSDVQEKDFEDPSKDHFFHLWNTRAKSNAVAYNEIFRCIPTNDTTTLNSLAEYQKIAPLSQTNPDAALKKLRSRIKGRLVEFPLHFLIDEGENLLTFPESHIRLPMGKKSKILKIYT
ncbi:phospholipase D1-like isoform X4 [Gordionus sp. m RMFG-2023]|uniref:phospholipase D1-like isoform X4 n=1 Tax=Gordionus sp. m RMFG-2023 TaxID=3053472 RepID=UPI0031FC5D5C